MSTSRNTLSGRPTTAVLPTHRTTAERMTPFEVARHVVLSAAKDVLFWAAVLALAVSIAACGDPAAPIPVATVTVSSATPGTGTLTSIGGTLQLSASVKDAEGNVLEDRTVTWSTSNADVATVTNGALVTAVGNGQVTITATADGTAGTMMVQVTQVVASVTVSPAPKQLASMGEVMQMAATAKDANGNVVPDKAFTWASSAPSTVKVEAATGVVTAMGNGTATMTATVDGLSNTADVTVNQAPAKLIFLGAPITAQNGVAINGVAVQVQDALGTRMFQGNYPVSVAIETNPNGGSLTGTTQIMSASANAVFTAVQIDKPAKGYKLSATSPGLTAATSAAFEIMDVPVRVDSLKVASANVKIGGSVVYTVWVTNGKGVNATNIAMQAYIVQGTFNNAAGGFSANCTTTFGLVPPGTCKSDLSANAGIGTYAPGAATLKIEVREGTTLRGTMTLPVTMVP